MSTPSAFTVLGVIVKAAWTPVHTNTDAIPIPKADDPLALNCIIRCLP